MNRLLQGIFGESHFFHAAESRYLQAPLGSLLKCFPAVSGHFSFARISDSLLETTFLFTFLRAPVERVLSLYGFYRQTAYEHVRDVALAKGSDLKSLLASVAEHPRSSPWSNWQTFLFSGAADCERPAAELLSRALRNLERVDFIGLQEQFDAGVQRLCEPRGWPAPAHAPRLNATAGRPSQDDVKPAVIERLRQLNECALQLYARARERWEKARSVPVNPEHRPAGDSPAAEASADAAHARVESGSKEVSFTRIRARGRRSPASGVIEQGDQMRIELTGRSEIAASDLTVGIRVNDDFGVEVYGVNTLLLGHSLALQAGQGFHLTFAFEMILAPGVYHLTVAIHSGDNHYHRCCHWIDNALAIECRRSQPPTFSGVADLKATVTSQSDLPELESVR